MSAADSLYCRLAADAAARKLCEETLAAAGILRTPRQGEPRLWLSRSGHPTAGPGSRSGYPAPQERS